MLPDIFIYLIFRENSMDVASFNKSRKSFVGKIWEAESAVSGDEGPQKSWGNKIRVRVRALTVMDLESHVLTRLPHT